MATFYSHKSIILQSQGGTEVAQWSHNPQVAGSNPAPASKTNTMSLNQLSKSIHQGNVQRGFYETQQANGTFLMLVVSELSEALEADRAGKHADLNYFNDRIKEIEETKGSKLSKE